jgi:membrane-bound metal-dependent hydrolase YbcI (DUF457 family)
VAAGAALAADIDEKHSKASQVAGPLGSFMRIFTGAHRTRTHWPLVIIPLLTAWVWALINVFGPGWELGATLGLTIALGWPFCTAAILPEKYEKVAAAIAIPVGIFVAWLAATKGFQPDWWLYAAIPVPYFTHLLGDTPTPAGISWLAPFTKTKFSAGLFKSGGFVENSIVSPLLLLAIGFVTWRLFDVGAFGGNWF